jgi:hypothetical protein
MKRPELLCLWTVCACAASEPSDPFASADLGDATYVTGGVDVEVALILRVEIEPGHTVSFYEPAPGVVGMVERLPAPRADAILAQNADIASVYRAIRPQTAMPTTLTDALARAANPPISGPQLVGKLAGGGQPSRRRTGDAISFINDAGFCDATHSQTRWTLCRINWWGGFWAWDGGARTIHGMVYNAHESQNMTTRVQVNTNTFDLQMWAGQNAYFTFGSGTAGMRRVDVFNAENEEFHISTQFLDSALNIGWW